jgi:hypothetical protein
LQIFAPDEPAGSSGAFYLRNPMNNGWVRLWRKIKETAFYKKPLICHLANHLVMSANIKDTETIFNGSPFMVKRGQCIVGRKKLAEETGLSEQEIRTALQSLNKCHFVTSKSTNRYTLITVTKYEKYQPNQPADQPAEQPAINQPSTTSKEVKKERKNTYNKNENQIIQIFPEVEQVVEHYKLVYGIKTLSRQTENVRAARDLLKDYGLNKVLQAINIAHEASGEEYAPMIGNLIKLKEKYSDLRLWYKRNHKDENQKMVDDVGEIKSSLGKVIKEKK